MREKPIQAGMYEWVRRVRPMWLVLVPATVALVIVLGGAYSMGRIENLTQAVIYATPTIMAVLFLYGAVKYVLGKSHTRAKRGEMGMLEKRFANTPRWVGPVLGGGGAALGLAAAYIAEGMESVMIVLTIAAPGVICTVGVVAWLRLMLKAEPPEQRS